LHFFLGWAFFPDDPTAFPVLTVRSRLRFCLPSPPCLYYGWVPIFFPGTHAATLMLVFSCPFFFYCSLCVARGSWVLTVPPIFLVYAFFFFFFMRGTESFFLLFLLRNPRRSMTPGSLTACDCQMFCFQKRPNSFSLICHGPPPLALVRFMFRPTCFF